MRKRQLCERGPGLLFALCGLTAVACLGAVTLYLTFNGLPALFKVGPKAFLLGREWAPTASIPSFGILPFILTTLWGTAAALFLGVPPGILCALYLTKYAPSKVRALLDQVINLLAGIPSVVYGLVGMMVLVPAVADFFDLPDGSGLLSATLLLAVMIFPTVVKLASDSLDAVPGPYEEASLALGATKAETYLRVTLPAAKSGLAASVVLGAGRAAGEAMAVMMVAGNAPNFPGWFESVRFLTAAAASEMSYASGLHRQALFSAALMLFLFIMVLNGLLNRLMKGGKGR